MTVHLRRATPADLPAIIETDGRAFGELSEPEDQEDVRLLLDPERFLLACDDDDTVAGVAGSFALDVTLPGGATLPVPGVSWVGVLATHRRRGVLRTLFTELHRGYVADGAVLSLLTATEGGIYGRFGYGPTTVDRAVEIDRRRAEFRPGVPDPGGVRFVDTGTARKHAPDVHRRWCAVTPGAVSRSDKEWDFVMRDPARHRGGASALFHLAHPDGYASFRRRDGGCEVQDLFAATEQALIALWRVVLSLDLVTTITSRRAVAVDDPLPLMLTDARVVATTGAKDGLWVRVLDAAAALGSRTYAVELDVVLEVDHDPFLDRGGRFRLRGGPEGATCEPTDAAPDLRVATVALGPLLFGGQRAFTLARAGLLGGAAPEVLRRVDAAFLTDRAPRHGTSF